jgi:hypothetical protein
MLEKHNHITYQFTDEIKKNSIVCAYKIKNPGEIS